MAQPPVQPTEIQNNNMNDGLSKLVQASELHDLNMRYTQFLKDTILKGVHNPLTLGPTAFQHPHSHMYTRSPNLVQAPKQQVIAPQMNHDIAPATAPRKRGRPPLPNRSPDVRHEGATTLQKKKMKPTAAPPPPAEQRNKASSLPAGSRLLPLYITDEQHKKLIKSYWDTASARKTPLKSWQIKPDGRVTGELLHMPATLSWKTNIIRLNEPVARQLLNADFPFNKKYTASCEIVYNEPGKGRRVWSAKVKVTRMPTRSRSFHIQDCLEFVNYLKSKKATFVTMQSMKRVQGEMIRIELLEMHTERPFEAPSSQKETESASIADTQPENDLDDDALVVDLTGDAAAAPRIERAPKRAKTETKEAKPVQYTTSFHTAEASSHKQQQKQQQQQKSPSISAFESFVFENFEMSFRELMVLPKMLEWMEECKTLSMFEGYLRRGHSNAQQVLNDALEEYMKK